MVRPGVRRSRCRSTDRRGSRACCAAGLFSGPPPAEKALKALLIDSGVPFRKIHDLLDLRLLLPAERQAGFDPDVLADLNGWVIDGRYADDHVEATEETARHLVELATAVITEVERLLGDAQ